MFLFIPTSVSTKLILHLFIWPTYEVNARSMLVCGSLSIKNDHKYTTSWYTKQENVILL